MAELTYTLFIPGRAMSPLCYPPLLPESSTTLVEGTLDLTVAPICLLEPQGLPNPQHMNCLAITSINTFTILTIEELK